MQSDPSTDREARAALLDLARKRTAPIPEELLVDHVLSVTAGSDWPVRRAAFEALLRRLAAARKEELEILSRPAGRAVRGEYRTGLRSGRAKHARPYRLLLDSVSPPSGSCGCPDFTKSSLGLCKHLLAVLLELHESPERIERAEKEPGRAGLRWDPIRPLTGSGDWLDGVSGAPATNGGASLARDMDPRSRVTKVKALARRLAKQDSPDPALEALIEADRERLERIDADADLRAKSHEHTSTLKRSLYKYQQEAVDRFLAAGRLLIADDMGLGKTIEAIACCHVLARGGRAQRGLVITPASLKPQWKREWEAMTDLPVALLEGTRDQRREQLAGTKRGFLIAGYEQVVRDLEAVQAFAPDVVVADEAQRMKNWSTKTARTIKSIDSRYRILLTGTPMENRLEDLASLLDWIDERALEPKWRLVPWHTRWEGDAGRQGKIGARNLDTLRQRIAGCVLRRVRAEVLSQLPARTDTRVPVEMSDAQRVEHDDRIEPILRLFSIMRKRPLTPAEHLRLMSLLTEQRIISNGLALHRFEELWPALSSSEPTPALLESLSAPKLQELRDLIEHLVIDQERKVIVFSQWRRMLRLAGWAISDILKKAGFKAVFFTGAESQALRERSVIELHDDPRTRVMFLSDAGGVGLNLQRAATACINLELPWNPAVLEQRISRIYRLGQQNPINVYHLATEVGIEARIAGAVETKRAMFTGLFDGTSDEIRFEHGASFLTQLEAIIEPEIKPISVANGDALEVEEEELDPVEVEHGPWADVLEDLSERERERVTATRAELVTEPIAEQRPRAESSGEAVTRQFASVAVRRRGDGGLTIEAPPDAAAALASVLEGVAGLLRQVAP